MKFATRWNKRALQSESVLSLSLSSGSAYMLLRCFRSLSASLYTRFLYVARGERPPVSVQFALSGLMIKRVKDQRSLPGYEDEERAYIEVSREFLTLIEEMYEEELDG